MSLKSVQMTRNSCLETLVITMSEVQRYDTFEHCDMETSRNYTTHGLVLFNTVIDVNYKRVNGPLYFNLYNLLLLL